MTAILWVMTGGALGASLRFLIGKLLPFSPPAFPWGTFFINLFGCLTIGILFGYLDKRHPDSEWIRLFWMSGFCGGFTTFSAFSLETFTLIQQERWPIALGYVLGSSLLGIFATWMGWTLFRS